MKTPLPLCLLLLAVFSKTISAQDVTIDESDVLDIENLDPTHRELFLKTRSQRNCISREILEFSDQFDALEFRDLIFEDAGVGVEELKQAQKESEKFSESPAFLAVMDAIEKHGEVLKQVDQIYYACQEEVEGGTSAVGAGVTVGKIFARALERANSRALAKDNQEADTDAPTASPSLSSNPSAAPSLSTSPSAAPSLSQVPTVAPSVAKPDYTPWPSYDYDYPTSTWEPTPSGTDIIFLGFHMEASLFLEFNQAWFTNGARRNCLGLTTGIGGDVSIIIMLTTSSDVVQYPCSTMVGIDAGLGAAVGAAAGSFGGILDFGGPPVFQVTLGAGLGLSVDISSCTHWWFRGC